MSDLEVLSLTAEYMGIDSENHLFRNLPGFFTDKVERSVYNRKSRKLAVYTNQIRLKLAETFNEFEDCFIIDSDLSAASVHDHYLKDIQSQIANCVLIGYKGYLSAEAQLNSFESAKIKLDITLNLLMDLKCTTSY